MDQRYYIDYDEDNDLWCVFDSEQEPHKAVSSWACKSDAQTECDNRNGVILIDKLNELIKIQMEALDSKDKLIKALDELIKDQD